jgi:F-type H+-transporting ATPase subunit epsilon
MEKTIFCDVTSAEEQKFSGKVRMVIASATKGEIGIYPGHTPLLSTLKPGPIHIICSDNTEQIYYLSGGFIEVQPSSIYVLADSAISSTELNESEVLKAQKAAEKLLQNKEAKVEYSKVIAELSELSSKLKTLRSIGKYLK